MMETIVMYGDSETALNGWTDVLATTISSKYNVVNTAKPGQTSAWGLANLQSHVIDYHPSIVVFEFSMNDAVWLTLEQAASNTITIINELRSKDPGVSIYLSTNNEPSTAAIAATPQLANVDAYYQQYRGLAAAMNVGLIDNEPLWQAAGVVPADGFHPTLEQDIQVQIPNVIRVLGLAQQEHLNHQHEGGLLK
jgi:lysophospholipase L1-like esterase